MGANNDFVSNSGLAVRLDGYSGLHETTVDLRDNYWGTSDPDSIAAVIWDGNDDQSILQTVQFEPFSAVPLDTEQGSLGGFKSMFR